MWTSLVVPAYETQIREGRMIRNRFSFFLLAVLLGVAIWVPAEAFASAPDSGDRNATTPGPSTKTQRKVFTNESLARPGSNSPAPATLESPAVATAGQGAGRPTSVASDTPVAQLEPYMQEQDPNWYVEQLAPLRAELGRVDSEMARLREFRASGAGMMSGLVLDQPSLRLTPENEIEQLGLRRQELQRQIDELEDTARRNDIPPGFLLALSPYVAAPAVHARSRLTLTEVGELEKQRGEVEAQLAGERAHLEFAKKELDLIGRDFVLFRQQFYSNPGYASDSEGAARLASLASQGTAKREEVSAAQEKITALQEELQTFGRALGPKPAGPLTVEQQRVAWQERLRPLREELARVEGQLAAMRANAAGRGLTLYPEDSTGSPTSVLLRQFETRAGTLRLQIEAIEEEARRAGALPGWLR